MSLKIIIEEDAGSSPACRQARCLVGGSSDGRAPHPRVDGFGTGPGASNLMPYTTTRCASLGDGRSARLRRPHSATLRQSVPGPVHLVWLPAHVDLPPVHLHPGPSVASGPCATSRPALCW